MKRVWQLFLRYVHISYGFIFGLFWRRLQVNNRPIQILTKGLIVASGGMAGYYTSLPPIEIVVLIYSLLALLFSFSPRNLAWLTLGFLFGIPICDAMQKVVLSQHLSTISYYLLVVTVINTWRYLRMSVQSSGSNLSTDVV